MHLFVAVVLIIQSHHWPLVHAVDPTAYYIYKTQEQPVVSLDLFSSRKPPHRTVASAMGEIG